MGQLRLSELMAKATASGAGRHALVVSAALSILLGWMTPASAAITLTASRSELLYSSDGNPDCSKLHKLMDSELPFNVTRLTATVQGGSTGAALGYHWSIRKSDHGTPAADLDLGPSDETSAINGMCAEFGNSCILTGKKLAFYNEKTLLFVAPTCDVLPDNTEKQFHGGVSRIKVRVTSGRRVVGRAAVKIGWGRIGSVVLYTWNGDTRNRDTFVLKDGLGDRNGVGVPLNAEFGATAEPPNPAPGTIQEFIFSNGGGGGATVPPGCDVKTTPPVDACAEADYTVGGRYVAIVTAKFADGSALCDKITTQILTCSGSLHLDVKPKPNRPIYDPSDPNRNATEVVVRLTNTSRSQNGLPPCGMLLRGAGVLTCVEALKVGTITDSRTTSFDLQHCSQTTGQPCDTDEDCSPVRPSLTIPAPCPECRSGERCLTRPHCSESVDIPCGNDADCDNQGQPPPCRDCHDDERCIRILNFGSEIFLGPRQSVILLDQPVTLRNVFSDTAKITDAWTAVTTLPAFTATDTVKYRIRGRPKQ